LSSPLDNIDLKDIPTILPMLSLAEQEKLLAELKHLEELKSRTLSQEKFMHFVNKAWPTFIGGETPCQNGCGV
jgi:hypothetical protein